jgi:spore maturation protein CgeB
MRIKMFYHSLVSDWNHGNAHFLRGIASELVARGEHVEIFTPADAWSLQNLRAEFGEEPIRKFHAAYPHLHSTDYTLDTLDLEAALEGADLVLVHEWNAPELIRAIGQHRARNDYVLLFHDTHHRMVTEPQCMPSADLGNYDGVLAYGEVLRSIYESRQIAQRASTWHEAADVRIFKPIADVEKHGDFVWIGNWGDEERTAELHEFLIEPARSLHLKTTVYGVRYPDHARAALSEAGIHYGNWLPNFEAPRVFAGFKFTVHVPRRPYVKKLPGIPTIRPFEALACGIPLICSPWHDAENLFRPGKDYLIARDGEEMKAQMSRILNEPDLAADLARSGLETIRSRHTCAHRVNELLAIYRSIISKAVPRTQKNALIRNNPMTEEVGA